MVATGVDVGRHPIDLAFVGTEHGAFYAIDVADGGSCGSGSSPTQTLECSESPDNIFGVTAAARHRPARNRVYVAAADGKVHALDLATGREVDGWPVTITDNPDVDFVWGAPTLWKGRLYVGTASHCDSGPEKAGSPPSTRARPRRRTCSGSATRARRSAEVCGVGAGCRSIPRPATSSR